MSNLKYAMTISILEKRKVVVPIFVGNEAYQQDWDDATKLTWFSYQRIRKLDHFMPRITESDLKEVTEVFGFPKEKDSSILIKKPTDLEFKLRLYRTFIELGLFDILVENSITDTIFKSVKENIEKTRKQKLNRKEIERLYVMILEERLQKEDLDHILNTHFSTEYEIKTDPICNSLTKKMIL